MDLEWTEMPSKVNFVTSKMSDQSEMVRNAIQSDFQTSKMAAGKNGRRQPFCQKCQTKKSCVSI